MDTALLHTLLVVARRQSFTAAAGELHVVQSTVTARIQTLERELGVRLFDRVPPGARLTAVGDEVAAHAREMLDAEQRLLEVTSTPSTPAGEVLIGAPESICAYRLPEVVAQVRRAHPGINLHLEPLGTEQTLRALLSRRLDLGLVLDDREAAAPLESRRLGAEPVALVAARDDSEVTGRVSWADLAEIPLYLLEEGCSYTDAFLDELRRRVGRTPSVTRFGSIEAARACVEAGLGLSVLPLVALGSGARAQAIVPLQDIRLPAASLALVSDGRRWRSSAVTAVVEALEQAAVTWG